MTGLKPTQDAVLVVRAQRDALSIALEVYQKVWVEAEAEGRPLPEPPRIAPGPVIRTDTVKIRFLCPESNNCER